MSVDRELRSSLFDAVTSYMKGEVGSFALDDCITNLLERCWKQDQSAAHVAQVFWLLYDDFTEHPLCTTENGWNLLCRYAAFLRTDLELEAHHVWQRHRGQWFARGCLLALLLGLLISLWSGRWPILLVVYLIAGLFHECGWPQTQIDVEMDHVLEYAPFWTEAEWREYSPGLDVARLPNYSPVGHRRRWKRGHLLVTPSLWPHRIIKALFYPVTLLWKLRPIKHEVFMVRRHCRRCGYNLTGNVSGICPECGLETTDQAGAER